MKTKRSDVPRLIPITGLRHLYRQLRALPETKYQLALATECVRKPAFLQELVQKSIEHFAYYDNRDEGFRPEPGKVTPQRERSHKLSDQMVSVFSSSRVALAGGHPVPFTFVDYDISPFRTTGSESEEGRSGSGAGGIDLLLAASDGSLPVIVEIKAPGDTSLFMAFVQALTYAVEMSTPAQRSRLDRAYPDRFRWFADGPWVDLCLLTVHSKCDERSEEFVRLTHQLCDATVIPATAIGDLVRSVDCFEVTFNIEGGATLVSRFHLPAKPL
jgi:hypothetical protein